jgi:mannose-1-phosphate guanylyltransferase / phosphomannomutase
MSTSQIAQPARPLLAAGRAVKALVLAAGEGTRLRPLTLDRPKPMVPINGVPLLDIIMRQLARAGITDVAINLHYKPEAITQFVGDGSAYGVRVRYAPEERLMGSAGAAKNIQQWLGDHPLLVVYGDVLTDMDLTALVRFHEARLQDFPDLAATLSLNRVLNPTEVGLVGVDSQHRITRFLEKPSAAQVFTDVANAGVCVVEPDVLNLIEPDVTTDFGLHVFPELLARNRALCGWLISDSTYLLDIGSPEKYAQANRDWALRPG